MSTAANAAMLREMAIQAAVALEQQSSTRSCARLSFIDSGFSTKAEWLAARQRAMASKPSLLDVEALYSGPSREPKSTAGWTEIFLNPAEAGACGSAGASIAAGHSIVAVANLASAAECEALLSELKASCEREADNRLEEPHCPTSRTNQQGGSTTLVSERQPDLFAPSAGQREIPDLQRIPTVGLGAEGQSLCNELLLRALEWVDSDLPALATAAFGGAFAATLRSQGKPCVDHPGLEFNK